MILLWEIDTPVEPRLLSLMQTAADCALWAEGVRLPCVVNVRLCGDEDIREINKEQCLNTYGLLACLKGLREQGCNGPVTEAINKIEKHLNKQAHDMED